MSSGRPNAGTHRALTLLVIDDHPAFHAAIDVMCVADGGIEVAAHATSVAEGMAALDGEPDLVLLDVNMAEIDGITGARMIIAERPDLPIIICSTAPRRALPPLPDHPGVTFIGKEDLDAAALHDWYRARCGRRD